MVHNTPQTIIKYNIVLSKYFRAVCISYITSSATDVSTYYLFPWGGIPYTKSYELARRDAKRYELCRTFFLKKCKINFLFLFQKIMNYIGFFLLYILQKIIQQLFSGILGNSGTISKSLWSLLIYEILQR